ncbi:MAG TPA: hypothetical protein VHZ75_05750 [Solirubrobacteraceae bacterium]|jgi:hypothetical protein|nr:hypothetical protein [Solirubrobacteraceae bacterium]
MKLRPPTPALAISIIALVVACSGSAVAATLITSSQIKNGTITGLDVKNSSISLSKLTKGTQNLIHKKTTAAAAGGKVAYEVTRKAGPENQPANVIVKIATLSVPAGAWVVQANTIMTAFTGPTNPLQALLGADGSLGGTCTLDTGGPTDSSTGTIVVEHRQTPTTMSMQMTRTVGAPTDFFVQCSATAPWRTSETSIIATPVDSISLTDVPAGTA